MKMVPTSSSPKIFLVETRCVELRQNFLDLWNVCDLMEMLLILDDDLTGRSSCAVRRTLKGHADSYY